MMHMTREWLTDYGSVESNHGIILNNSICCQVQLSTTPETSPSPTEQISFNAWKTTISITVDNVATNYPSPVTFNILFGVGAAMAIACVFLAIRMKHLATKMKPLVAKEMV